MPSFPAVTHVAVTVTDLHLSTSWYATLFGTEAVLDEDEQIGGSHHPAQTPAIGAEPLPPGRLPPSISGSNRSSSGRTTPEQGSTQ